MPFTPEEIEKIRARFGGTPVPGSSASPQVSSEDKDIAQEIQRIQATPTEDEDIAREITEKQDILSTLPPSVVSEGLGLGQLKTGSPEFKEFLQRRQEGGEGSNLSRATVAGIDTTGIEREVPSILDRAGTALSGVLPGQAIPTLAGKIAKHVPGIVEQIPGAAKDIITDIPSDIAELGTDTLKGLDEAAMKFATKAIEIENDRDPAKKLIRHGINTLLGPGTALGVETFAKLFTTGAKILLPQDIEDAIEQSFEGVVDAATKTQTAKDLASSWNELPPEAQEALGAVGNVIDAGALGGLSKPFTKLLKEVIKQTGKGARAIAAAKDTATESLENLFKGKPVVKPDVVRVGNIQIPTDQATVAGGILQRIHKPLPNKAQKFAERSGQPIGEWLVDRGIVDTPEGTIQKLLDRFNKSKAAADEGFSKIPGTFKDNTLIKVSNELLERERAIAKKGAASRDKKFIENLARKLETEGLTMAEINSLKRLYERKVKTEFIKDSNSTSLDIQAKTNLDSALREFQANEAKKAGFSDLAEINKETMLSRAALDAIGERYLRAQSNNAVSLTDWVVATGSAVNPQFLGALVGKKLLSSDIFQSQIAKILASGKKTIGEPELKSLQGIERKAKIKEFREKPPLNKAGAATNATNVSAKGNFNTLVEKIIENPGGFTLTIDGKSVTNGFAFSPYKGRELAIPRSKVTAEALESYYLANKDLLDTEGNFFGGWLNKKDGKFYLDVSRVDKDIKTAMIKAKENDQIAIYDIGTGKEFFTKEFDPLGNREKAGGIPK